MKLFAARGALFFGSAVVLLGLSACTNKAVLSVVPSAVSLSDASPMANIRVSNEGKGTLNWTATSDAPWLELATETGDEWLSGISISTTTTDILRLRLNSSILPEDQESLRATVRFSSNGGSAEVAAAVERMRTPVLGVAPEKLDFGDQENSLLLEILNQGDAVLQWEIIKPETASWLVITPNTGNVNRQSAQGVEVRINRGDLAPAITPYGAVLTVESNGGSKTVEVSASQPAFTASPDALAFGTLSQPLTLLITLSTQSNEEVVLAASSSDAWLTLDTTAPRASRSKPYELRVTANPHETSGPGDYNATVTVSHPATGRSVTISTTMTVVAPATYRLEPTLIDFGETREIVQRPLQIINESATAVEWRIEKPAAGAGWLAIEPEAGLLENTVDVTLTADATALPSGPANANLMVYVGSTPTMLPVRLIRQRDPIPDALQVEPRVLGFGALLNQLEIVLWNEGPNSIDWAVEETGLPDWLQMEPMSGKVGGVQAQTVKVSLDRELAPKEVDFDHVFRIISSVAEQEAVEVFVYGEPRRVPIIEVIGEDPDSTIATMIIEIGKDSDSFYIANRGNADLSWRIDIEKKPIWITNITPKQGLVKPGRQQMVLVTTNRQGLTGNGGIHTFEIESNDPDHPKTPLEVQVRCPYIIKPVADVPCIEGCCTVRTLDYGTEQSVLGFYVSNYGDSGYPPMEWVITDNLREEQKWVFAEPNRGSTLVAGGCMGAPVEVVVDRSLIPAIGGRAKLWIDAVNVPPNAAWPVERWEIDIVVEALPLTIECARPQVQVPSLLRFNMLLRDVAQRTFPVLEDGRWPGKTMYDVSNVSAEILEDRVPLETSETYVFIKKQEVGEDGHFRYAVLVLLDYSGSMNATAEALVVNGQLDPGALPSLDALYQQTVGPMLQDFSEHYRIALAIFNERRYMQESFRVITGAPDGYSPAQAAAEFTQDKAILQYRLAHTDVLDYGATPTNEDYDHAFLGSAGRLAGLDDGYPEVERVNERMLVTITDGRETTVFPALRNVSDDFVDLRVRFFPILFGLQTRSARLTKIAAVSGGHLYRTQVKEIPDELTPEGDPLVVPVFDSLLGVCRSDPSDQKIRSLPEDFRSHVVLSYPTLTEAPFGFAANITVIDINAANPSVQGLKTVSNIYAPPGDVRLGQIGLRTQGIQPNGTAVVRVFADYIPRNIKSLKFNITSLPGYAYDVILVHENNGGLVSNWNLTRSGNAVTVASAEDRALTYGNYGNLFDLVFSSVSGPFTLFFEVTDPVRTSHPDSKAFICPESMWISDTHAVATAFPNPQFTFAPDLESEAPPTINIGLVSDQNNPPSLTVLIENVGGQHLPSDVALYWSWVSGTSFLPGTRLGSISPEIYSEPNTGNYNRVDPDNEGLPGVTQYGKLAPNLSLTDHSVPGEYSQDFYFKVYYGALDNEEPKFYSYTYGPYYIKYTVP